MKVVNLEPWAGLDFGYAPGEEIDLPDAVATDRLAAGLCRLPDPPKSKLSKLFKPDPVAAPDAADPAA
jgi:hypothetical protein